MGEVTPIDRPRGLLCVDGQWVMDKRVYGVRVHERLKTADYAIALDRFHALLETYSRQAGSVVWEERCRAMLDDRGSWVYQTIARKRSEAKACGREFGITPGQLVSILVGSEGRCMVTGIEFSDWKPANARIPPFRMSVDRVDSTKGYTADNCRVVLLCVNLAMRDWGDAVMVQIAEAMMLKHLQEKMDALTRLRNSKKSPPRGA